MSLFSEETEGIALDRNRRSPAFGVALGGMLAALAVVMRLLHMETMLVNVAVVQMAMPTAISGSMMCMEFGGDADTMARITFLTTVLSIITIPVAAALFM